MNNDGTGPPAPPGDPTAPQPTEELMPSVSLEDTLKWATGYIQENSKPQPDVGGETLDDSHF